LPLPLAFLSLTPAFFPLCPLFSSMHTHFIYVRRVQLLGSLVGLFSLLVTLKIKSNMACAGVKRVDPGVALVAAMVQWYIGLATLRMLRRSRVRVRVRNRWAKNTCPHQAPMSRRAHVGGLPWHYCHMHMRNVWIQAGCQTGDWVVRVATCAQEPVVACTCRLPSPPQAHYYYYYYYY